MTNKELTALVAYLKQIFDIVRLVDVTLTKQYLINDEGVLVEEPYHCYTVWKKTSRCENCISAKAFIQKKRLTKFEFVESEVYHVIAKYIIVDDKEYVLEMVCKITDEVLFDAYGENEFVETINGYNHRLYVDVLTGVYNRRYFDEQLSGLANHYAIAMLDVDNFKTINDRYGHLIGDKSLHMIAKAISQCVATRDAVVRYGGDEFLIVFQEEMSKEELIKKLEHIREKIQLIRLKDFPEIHFSISIGAIHSPSKNTNNIRNADIMLYEAKNTKNCVKVR